MIKKVLVSVLLALSLLALAMVTLAAPVGDLSTRVATGVIDNRLSFVDLEFQEDTGRLVLDVEARVTDGTSYEIVAFENAFMLDGTFTEQIIGVQFSNQVFTSPTYLAVEDFTRATGDQWSRIRYMYTHDTGSDLVTISGTNWSPILRVSLQFTQVAATGSISWYANVPDYQVTVVPNEDVTGAEIPMGPELEEILLCKPWGYLPIVIRWPLS